jgi:hypothetical protein
MHFRGYNRTTGSDDERVTDLPTWLEQHLSDFCERIDEPHSAGVIEQYQQKLQEQVRVSSPCLSVSTYPPL